MGTRENKVEQYLDEQIGKIGGITRKWVSPGRDGVPDRIVIFASEIYFVEVKVENGKLSITQEREHYRLMKSGVNITTVFGNKGVDNFIRHVLVINESELIKNSTDIQSCYR